MMVTTDTQMEEGAAGGSHVGASGVVAAAAAAAAKEEAAAAEKEKEEEVPGPGGPNLCGICFESWTCSGDHRICCIPCGHVFGRSCVERWLDGQQSAKCPSCKKPYGHENIINLFAEKSLFDGCCKVQELKRQMTNEILSLTKQYRDEVTREQEERMAALKQELHEERTKFEDCVRAEIASCFNMRVNEEVKRRLHAKQ